MHFAEMVRARLIESDPGLLRVRQAVKSVIAVGVAVALFWRAGGAVPLFAGITTAFLMQSTDTGSRARQQWSMTATAVALMIMTPFGSVLHGNRLAEAALLIAWAAAVFYARRFLQGNGAFTLFSFTAVLLATALPGRPKDQFLTALAGFAIAFVLRFYIWPPDESRAFRDAVQAFRAHAVRIMEGDDSSEHVEGVRAAVLFTNNLLREHPEMDSDVVCARVVERQYEALQSLRMLRQARLREATEAGEACLPVHQTVRELAECRLAEIHREFEGDPA